MIGYGAFTHSVLDIFNLFCILILSTIFFTKFLVQQADEFELAEEGGDGTMIDFNMQQGEPDYSSRYAPEEYAL